VSSGGPALAALAIGSLGKRGRFNAVAHALSIFEKILLEEYVVAAVRVADAHFKDSNSKS
jgi:hypothetical protein